MYTIGKTTPRMAAFAVVVLLALISCSGLTSQPTSEPPNPIDETQTAPAIPPALTFTPTLRPTVEPTRIPITIVPVPTSEIKIDGRTYLSFQQPGDPFRFVCQQPCNVDPAMVEAFHAAFRAGHARLVQLIGIDTLPELQPVDIHLTGDSKCGELPPEGATLFANYEQPGNAYTCMFFLGDPASLAFYTPETASLLYNQSGFLHEYMHTIFFGRLDAQIYGMHDFVYPIAVFVSDESWTEKNLCWYWVGDPIGEFGGDLLPQLCTHNGFTLEKWKASLIALDALYQSGGGTVDQGFSLPSVSPAQYRQILSDALGNDTRDSFAKACWPADLFGDDYSLNEVCLAPVPAATAANSVSILAVDPPQSEGVGSSPFISVRVSYTLFDIEGWVWVQMAAFSDSNCTQQVSNPAALGPYADTSIWRIPGSGAVTVYLKASNVTAAYLGVSARLTDINNEDLEPAVDSGVQACLPVHP